MKNPKELCKKYQKILIVLLISIVCSIFIETLYNLPVKKQNDYQYIPIENIKTDNFYLINGNTFVSHGGEASLTIPVDKQFIDKFSYKFEYDQVNAMECDLEISYYDLFAKEPLTEVVHDVNNYVLNHSTVNIRKIADQIVLKMGKNSSTVSISMIAINNTENISISRLMFSMFVTFLILFLIVSWKSEKVLQLEKIFLIIILGIGSISIFSMPSHKVGFDEEIHFWRAYSMGDVLTGKEEIQYPAGIEELTTTSLSNWPYHLQESEEEMKEENAYRNIMSSYKKEDSGVNWITTKNSNRALYTVSYIFPWLMIKLGMMLNVPFVVLFQMGRMGNLIFYAGVIYFAISHIKTGKRILFMLALMPTAVMSAITYSYDAWVNAFSFLGFAYLSEEWLNSERKISYKNCFIFIGAFILAGLPKAVYIPLLLIALLFPGTKFRNKKEKIIFKICISVVFLMMMGTFMLPAISNPTQLQGDSRGGATDGGGQLAFIFRHPVYYSRLLLTSIKDTFFSFTIGLEGLARMGHFSKQANASLIMIVMAYVVLTDCKKDEKHLPWWGKAATLLVGVGVLCLIWTALYISFTPVGLNKINGVHGRYYLPVTIWILWILRNKRIQLELSQKRDTVVLTGLSLLILLPIIYTNIIVSCF